MGVKYRLQGEDTLSREIRIDIGDDVYVGAMTTLRLISANLTREQGDGGILATSLSITAMSMQDGDCEALYVRDSTRWFVDLYIDNVIQWRGYILRELKDTYYRNSPCEVKIKAVDGIAVLKEIKYRPSYNRISLWGILTWIATRTRLSSEVCAMDNMAASHIVGTMQERNWLATTYINDAVFKGMTVYDMLAIVTENLSAYFTQVEGNFLFFRIDGLTKSALNAISIKSTNNSWYYKIAPGKIGSMASEADFSPVGTFIERVEPAKKYLPVTIEREPMSALGEPSMLVSLPTWTATNTPVNYIHTAGVNRQLFVSHGTYTRTVSMKAPGYPTKLKISGASLGQGKMYIKVYTGSYIYDFEHKYTADGANKWYRPSGTTLPDLGVYHQFEGKISLMEGYPTTNIPYSYYRVDQMEMLELELDAFPSDAVGNKMPISVIITVDKDNNYQASDTAKKMHGIWIGDIVLESEAFDDVEELYVSLNDDAIDEADKFTMLIQESPDDNGSELFIPGVITDSSAKPLHYVNNKRGVQFDLMKFNELIARERGYLHKNDRKILKGEILGTDAFKRLFFYNIDSNYIYYPVKLDCDIINRISSIELMSLMSSSAFPTLDYPLITADELEDDYESIAEKEYRLKVEFTEVTAKGGNLAKAVYLETYEFGELKSRSALTANATTGYTMEILDTIDWARTRSNGTGITVDKQPLKTGDERACRVKVKYTIDGVEIFKIATARQQANTYEVTNRALTAEAYLKCYNDYMTSADGKTLIFWKGGGIINFFDYSGRVYTETRVWASGDTEEASISEEVRMELTGAWEGLQMINIGGIFLGLASDSTTEQRECTLKLLNVYTGESVIEKQVHQFNLHKAVEGVTLDLRNSDKRWEVAESGTINNVKNKAILDLQYDPLNTAETSTIDLQALNTVMTAEPMDGGRWYVLTLRANAGSGSNTLKVTTASGLVQTLTIKYVYNS